MSVRGLEEKTIVVTGAAQGIGAAYARRLIDEGSTVVMTDCNREGLKATAATLDRLDKVFTHEVDVTNRASCETLATALADAHGHIDGLINNAAMFSTITMKPFWEITDEEWNQVQAVNVRGPWLMTSTLLPLLTRANAASIVNIGSDAVLLGRPGYLHYIASKGGVHGMTYSMARELGQFGIRVNTLSPGPVYTEVPRETVTPEQRDTMLAGQALHRTASPEDMLGTAAFLLSDDATYLTGQTISVNAGLVHR